MDSATKQMVIRAAKRIEADKRMHIGNTPGQPDYSNTYWSHKGKHEALIAKLNKLVPSSGEIPGWSADHNAALETFRIASNCYCDLYNNGLGNRGAEFIEAFGFCAIALAENGRDDCDDFSDHGHLDHPIELTQELIDRTEAKMDEIIVLAAHEQHIGEVKAETIELSKKLIEALEQGGWETRSYSGRGMDGRTCISVRDGDEKVSAWEIAKHLFSEEYDGEFDRVPEPQQDQLGLGIVLYWPRYEWPEEEADNG